MPRAHLGSALGLVHLLLGLAPGPLLGRARGHVRRVQLLLLLLDHTLTRVTCRLLDDDALRLHRREPRRLGRLPLRVGLAQLLLVLLPGALALLALLRLAQCALLLARVRGQP